MKQPSTTHTGRALIYPAADIDTDQIIPARFLTRPRAAGFADALFADRPDFRRDSGCTVLVAGSNFGCGSSREHAVWALVDAGFRAVIAPQFADIFRANALKNGLLAVESATATEVQGAVPAGTSPEVCIDLLDQTLSIAGGPAASFRLDPFARHCLLHGIDEMDFLLSHSAAISAHDLSRPAGGHHG